MLAFLTVALLALKSVNGQANLPPIPKDKTTPISQRLSFQGSTVMIVGWSTYQKIANPTVLYGTTPSKLTNSASSSESNTYPSSRTWQNNVKITGLSPATTYYYKIVSTNSSVDSFKTARSAGDFTPFTAAAVVDLGVYGADGYTLSPAKREFKREIVPRVDPSLTHTTIGRLESIASQYDFVFHPGDLAYADDWFEKAHNFLDGKNAYEAILEQFYIQLSAVSRFKPYMVSPGNHEADCTEIPLTSFLCPPGQANFTDFMKRFVMPTVTPSTSIVSAAAAARKQAAALAVPPFWFSFDYGMVHFVMFDTETDFVNAPDTPGQSPGLNAGNFGRTGQQLAFIEADLSSVDRTITPWVVVAGHRPWYSTTEKSGDTLCTACQAAFESLFYKYGVDLAVFGHVHNSQFISPIYNNTIDPAGLNNPKAPMYIVAGGAGNIEGHSPADNKPAYVNFVNDVDFAFGLLKFQDKNNLQIQFIRSDNGAVLNTSTLYKAHTAQFIVQA